MKIRVISLCFTMLLLLVPRLSLAAGAQSSAATQPAEATTSATTSNNTPTDASKDLFMPTMAAGFSHPLIFSISAGALLPIRKVDSLKLFSDVPALRADLEIGLGGYSLSSGFYVPVHEVAFINIKAARMWTWLQGMTIIPTTSYDGAIFEIGARGHMPVKIGSGIFSRTDRLSNAKLVYIFLGVGW